jgi:hypothetical protein
MTWVEQQGEPEAAARKRREPKEMSSDELAAAFGLATRLRAHEVGWQLDHHLRAWLEAAREELNVRNELERVREHLPVYYDPSRKATVFGPGAPLASQAAIERAITHPGTPARAITAG